MSIKTDMHAQIESLQDLKIHKSKNYSDFKLLEYNRKINLAHVKKLARSFSEGGDGCTSPILVTADKEIINGQHRFMAMRELGLPIYYIIDYSFRPDRLIKTNTNHLTWSMTDSLNYYVNLGYEEYHRLERFLQKHELELKQFTALTNSRRSTDFSSDFRDGKYKFLVTTKSYKVIEAHTSIKNFYIQAGLKKDLAFRSANYLAAVKKFFEHQDIDSTRFFDRLNTKPASFVSYANANDHLKQLINIYNYNLKKDLLKYTQNGKEIIFFK